MNKAMQLKARIKNIALKNHLPAQAVLQNYMLERLLERISLSRYKDMVVLQGGMLISALVGIHQRTTMDLDATLRGYPLTEEAILPALTEICAVSLDDGVVFGVERIEPIREDDVYGGFRAAIRADFESIHTPLKIDITTGDIITPEAVRYTYQSNFEDRCINIWAYTIETILAEKVETILRRSVLNTRPRDYYDVYIMMKTQAQAFSKDTFTTALAATCEKRMSKNLIAAKDMILETIRSNPTMRKRWDRYCLDNYYAAGIGYDIVMDEISSLLDDTINNVNKHSQIASIPEQNEEIG